MQGASTSHITQIMESISLHMPQLSLFKSAIVPWIPSSRCLGSNGSVFSSLPLPIGSLPKKANHLANHLCPLNPGHVHFHWRVSKLSFWSRSVTENSLVAQKSGWKEGKRNLVSKLKVVPALALHSYRIFYIWIVFWSSFFPFSSFSFISCWI